MLTEKDYCDYDTCVALKELGFKGYSKYFYTDKEPQKLQQKGQLYFTIRTATACDYVLAIHLYEAQKWLREEKGVVVLVHHIMTLEGDWEWEISYRYSSKDMYHSYEEALLEGIKEAIKLLKEEK